MGTSRPRPDLGALVSRPRRAQGLAQERDGIGETEPGPYIELRYSDVLCRALRLWKSAGGPEARVLEFWLQAEVELLSESLQRRTNGNGLRALDVREQARAVSSQRGIRKSPGRAIAPNPAPTHALSC